MHTSILILIAVLTLIAVRSVGSLRFQIWQVMLLGAIAVLVTGQISLSDAIASVNVDIMIFLFGMFVVGEALEESGYLAHLSYKYFKRAQSRDALILMILFGGGIASAFLMNDTLAIVGTPVVLLLARKHLMSPKLLLLTLCFAVTIGSVMSPIGNPQNLLIAIQGQIQNPFLTFLRWLLVPTLINLFLAYLMLKFFFKDDFHTADLTHSQEPIKSRELAFLSRVSLNIAAFLVGAKIVTGVLVPSLDFRLTHIAIASALPILFGSSDRMKILRRVDWSTLVFFAAMFVLMESVWNSGVLQGILASLEVDISATSMILIITIGLSQLISNVPLVALFLPVVAEAGGAVKELMALAAGSTIAGNLFVLGAASNVIIIQRAEKRGGETITFLEFARVGIPLTILNAFVYWLFL